MTQEGNRGAGLGEAKVEDQNAGKLKAWQRPALENKQNYCQLNATQSQLLNNSLTFRMRNKYVVYYPIH